MSNPASGRGEAESLTGARAVHLLSGCSASGPHLLDLRNDAAERLSMSAAWARNGAGSRRLPRPKRLGRTMMAKPLPWKGGHA